MRPGNSSTTSNVNVVRGMLLSVPSMIVAVLVLNAVVRRG